MSVLPIALTYFGRYGPVLMFLSLLLGIAIPTLSRAAETLVPQSAFLLTLGSFFSAALSPKEKMRFGASFLLVLFFVGIGVPALVYLVLEAASVDHATEEGIVLTSLAPPVGSAAALAAMLGLRPRLALAISIVLTAAAPVIMPVALALCDFPAAVDFRGVALRLSLIVGASAILAAAAIRWRNWSALVLPDVKAASGVSVVGLVIVGLAVGHGIAPVMDNPIRIASMLGIALGINVALSLVGTLVFLSTGHEDALTIGLLSGNRNVTLTWAVAGTALPPDVQSYLAICVVPARVLPLAMNVAMLCKSRVSRRQSYSRTEGRHVRRKAQSGISPPAAGDFDPRPDL